MLLRPLVMAGALLLPCAACGDDETTGGGGAVGTTGGGGAGGAGASSEGGAAPTGSSSSTGLPDTFTISGRVVDPFGDPIEGATVQQGGGEEQVVTGADGTFTVTLTQAIPGPPTAVASKVGYRAGGEEIYSLPDEPIEITLRIIRPPDNTAYVFGDPGVGDPLIDNSTLYCGHCHTRFVADFQTSAHARATRDPLVQDLYAGVASEIDLADCVARGGVPRDGTTPGSPGVAVRRCYIGGGVLPDLNGCGDTAGMSCDDPALPAAQKPTAFGACADCHALGMDGPAGGRDLLEAEGIAFENGNHCDACHHIRDVDLDAPAGNAGRLIMQRPQEKVSDDIGAPVRQAIFGPYRDVPNPFMGGSYQPKFSTAELCAGCHEQKQPALLPNAALAARFAGGLPTHSVFTEWQEGPFGNPETPCQSCHMPPIEDMFNSVDVSSPDLSGITGGFERRPEQLRSHRFIGPLTQTPGVPRLIDGALAITIDATPNAGTLEVSVRLANVACGHAFPTSEPMRSAVLAVDVSGCNETFVATGGMTVPDFGGANANAILGAGASLAGSTLTWASGAAAAAPGQVVRIVRPTGTYWDYDGMGLFEGDGLTPQEKGIENLVPVGTATIVSVTGDDIQLDTVLSASNGDVVYLGDPTPGAAVLDDGDVARALAGAPGMAFARVIVDPDGNRQVPHYRGVDIASDNRIGPQRNTTTTHEFAIPPGCTSATISATVIYRPLPLSQALERSWDARDYLVSEASTDVTIP